MKEGKIMITVSVKRLVDAVKEADIPRLPDMDKGTEYLYINLYMRLSRGEDVTLSSLDFDAFESEDIDSLNSLYSEVFEKNYRTADNIMSALKQIVPISKAVGYV
jgi:hypothetical protein